MKITKDVEGLGFQSFDITFTIESEEEARALYAIFNYSPNADLLGDDTALEVRRQIGLKWGELRSDQVIANCVTYEVFYHSKSSS